MKQLVLFAMSFVLAIALASSVCSAGPIIDKLSIDNHSISPNGDGVTDEMTISYELADTATAVHVIIRQSDSTTTVVTLVDGVAQLPGTPYSVIWDGTTGGGIRVADDYYVMFLRAVNDVASDSVFVPISVDVVTPQVFVTNKYPNPFAPELPPPGLQFITFEYATFDAFPSDMINVLAWIEDSNGDTLETILDTLVAPSPATSFRWDGASAEDDGVHELNILVADRAGNTDHTRSDFRIDLDSPDVEITSPETDGAVEEVPDSLLGWAWDANGIAAVQIRYSQNDDAFEPIPSTLLRMDTVFFSAQLLDSVTKPDTTYNIAVRALDRFGRATIRRLDIIWDTTPPSAPVLTQPEATTRNPTFVLKGGVSDDTDFLHIYRNGVPIDTVLHVAQIDPALPYTMKLVAGQNQIYAIAVDATGNTSPSSNLIVIALDDSPGMRVSQPFVRDDAFVIHLPRPASEVALRIYDIGGQLVTTLRDTGLDTKFQIPWDGRNGDGELATKGPLVAVAQIQYQDGGREIFRELFLFDR